jgi:hypothetical protein
LEWYACYGVCASLCDILLFTVAHNSNTDIIVFLRFFLLFLFLFLF